MTSAAIADPLLRRAFGQRACPSDPPRTTRVRIGSSRLRALVSQRGSATSRRIVMNNADQVEHTIESIEIVIHVNMLQEGWDVTNL
jgi:hypothetical protein